MAAEAHPRTGHRKPLGAFEYLCHHDFVARVQHHAQAGFSFGVYALDELAVTYGMRLAHEHERTVHAGQAHVFAARHELALDVGSQ